MAELQSRLSGFHLGLCLRVQREIVVRVVKEFSPEARVGNGVGLGVHLETNQLVAFGVIVIQLNREMYRANLVLDLLDNILLELVSPVHCARY